MIAHAPESQERTMPHEMIDEIQSRKGEKVAIFLTMENATGLVLGAIPGFLITFRALPWYLTFLITLSAGALGVLVTLEIGGMAFYERMVWWVRGALKQRLSTPRITPEASTGGRGVGQRDAALPLHGSVRLVRPKRPAHPQRVVSITPAEQAGGASQHSEWGQEAYADTSIE
jgi:hypothetical protein